jgi:hypothetical protein
MTNLENATIERKDLDIKTVERIFSGYNLGKVETVEKVSVGFTNKIYIINGKYILKVCEYEDNELDFEKETYFYNLFKGKLPIPEIIVFDKTKKLHDRYFSIYPMIQGVNLYSIWHTLSNEERKEMVRQLANYLKVIGNTDYTEFSNKFGIEPLTDWKEYILKKINKSLQEIKERKLLEPEMIERIELFIQENSSCLNEKKIGLAYWDTHFDNVLTDGKAITGILDFERTEIVSIDFLLNTVKRMMDYPKKYMAEQWEKFAKPEDYENLFSWLKEFYPDLFDFQDLDLRLRFYALNQDLRDLTMWPNSTTLKDMIEKSISV